MTEEKNRKVIPADTGFFDDVLLYMKLVIRLMLDPRVNIFLKMLPIGSLIYLVFPLDIPGPIDDAAILGIGIFMFIELCPPDVVEEHKQSLRGVIAERPKSKESQVPEYKEEDIIEAEYREE